MIKKIINDDFLKNNIIFFIGSMAVAVLNYLYHPILGRMMSVEDFGEAQALISLFMQLGIFMGVFNIITVNVAANYEDEKERDRIISALRRIAFYITGALFLAIIVLSPLLKNFFQFSSFYPFISLAFLLMTGVSFTFRKAFLQGVSNFKAVSWAGIISAAGRLGVIIIFLSGIFGIVIILDRYFINLGMNFSGPAILANIILSLVGIVLISLGLLAFYVGNIYEETRNRPMYIIRKSKVCKVCKACKI